MAIFSPLLLNCKVKIPVNPYAKDILTVIFAATKVPACQYCKDHPLLIFKDGWPIGRGVGLAPRTTQAPIPLPKHKITGENTISLSPEFACYYLQLPGEGRGNCHIKIQLH